VKKSAKCKEDKPKIGRLTTWPIRVESSSSSSSPSPSSSYLHMMWVIPSLESFLFRCSSFYSFSLLSPSFEEGDLVES